MHEHSSGVLIVATFFAAATAFFWYQVGSICSWQYFFATRWALQLLCIGVTLLLALSTVLLLYLALVLPVSRLHRSLSSLLIHYGFVIYYNVLAYFYWEKFKQATKQVRKEQDDILRRILKRNANTEYGRKMKFCNIKDRYDFRDKHPFCTYETYREYVDRMVNTGENNLISCANVSIFNVSSGTTGKSKNLPVCVDNIRNFENINYWHYLPWLLHSTPYLAPLKSLAMYFTPRWRSSPFMIPVGPGSVFPPSFTIFSLSLTRSTPQAANMPLSEAAQTHLHWLFALYDPDLTRVDAVYGGNLVAAMEYLGNNWQLLVEDVKNGRITDNSKLQIPAEVQNDISPYLWPDPKRAEVLLGQFKFGLQGVVSRIWPRVDMSYVIVTGAHTVHIDRLRYFFGPSVQIFSTVYVASDMGVVAINLNHPRFTKRNPDVSAQNEYFTFIPNAGVFYEFIPITQDETDESALENPKNSVFLEELEIGKRYDVAITSDVSGFYRYRMGDIIEIVDFYNETPVMKFCARVGSLLDLRGEKTSEDMVFSALLNCVAKRWPGSKRLANYTSSESVSLRRVLAGDTSYRYLFSAEDDSRLFYMIFVEVEGLERQLSKTEVEAFDEELKLTATGPYPIWRRGDHIAMPKVFTVKAGTFERWKLRTLEISKAVSNQYKTPRYIKTEDHIRFLLEQILK